MDTVSVNSTQNIAIDFQLAGLFQRIGAFLIDSLVIAAFYLLVYLVIGSAEVNPPTWFWVIIGLISYLYFLVSEAFFNGQTIGKRALDIRVLKLDGSAPTLSAYLLRWIMVPIDYGMYGSVAMILVIFTKNGQRLGDLLAGTTVVKIKKVDAALLKNKSVMKQVDENYEPTFPDATKLDDNDIRLIHASIAAFRNRSQRKPSELLKEKLEAKMQVKSELPPVKFLHTVAKDYAWYSSR